MAICTNDGAKEKQCLYDADYSLIDVETLLEARALQNSYVDKVRKLLESLRELMQETREEEPVPEPQQRVKREWKALSQATAAEYGLPVSERERLEN